MVVVSNRSRVSHLLKQGEEIGTVCKVSVINPPDKNTDPHLQTVSFTEIGCADEDSLILYLPILCLLKKTSSLFVVPVDENDWPDDLIPGTEDETPDVVELVTDEQFLQER